MINLAMELENAKSVAIAGHIRPDGDAIGSCLGLYHYLKKNYPDIDVTVYMEEIPDAYALIAGVSEICHDFGQEKTFDVFFCMDCADEERLGKAAVYRNNAAKTICIDHHVSNGGFAEVNYIVPGASSTSELVFELLDEDKITLEAAEALYMGIAHDTGVFRHSSTTPETMEIAAKLMRKGVRFSKIINDTYYEKTYHQNQILGRALLESILVMDKKVIFSAVREKDMDFYGVTPSDMDGIVQTLMATAGTEVAIFMYEISPRTYKVSLRSKEIVDVSTVAAYFGGGGHVHAAGCTMQGSIYDVVNNITLHIEQQLQKVEELD
ncbi:MAG TPA: bifunctional oligoribonuclease/PAP phosphatase NrnA [Candidatus Choladousia intestinipullorum]|nr:bifunctional oligoribonuclease/PAP phosphatase NrnA [Candidatus Choladousia intestinipullorum]